uniref:Uncharacterized protein n=1 Tax=Romanomermis culicivorax TaxID=13658 RepID=A0A915JF32_ROMCU
MPAIVNALASHPITLVQGAAFQALGQFISTFADINRTGLQWVDGELKYDESQIMQLQSSSL